MASKNAKILASPRKPGNNRLASQIEALAMPYKTPISQYDVDVVEQCDTYGVVIWHSSVVQGELGLFSFKDFVGDSYMDIINLKDANRLSSHEVQKVVFGRYSRVVNNYFFFAAIRE